MWPRDSLSCAFDGEVAVRRFNAAANWSVRRSISGPTSAKGCRHHFLCTSSVEKFPPYAKQLFHHQDRKYQLPKHMELGAEKISSSTVTMIARIMSSLFQSGLQMQHLATYCHTSKCTMRKKTINVTSIVKYQTVKHLRVVS